MPTKKTTKRKTTKKKRRQPKEKPAQEIRPSDKIKRRRFAEEYIKDLNATQAAIRAGYSEKTAKQQGSRLLTYDDVQEMVTDAVQKLVERIEVDQDFVVEGLVKNYERAMREVEVTDREGNPIGEFTYQGNVANKSLELLGRYLGMFTDKIQISKHEDALDDLE